MSWGYCDYNLTALKDDVYRAAKEHRCCECGGKIVRGSLYWLFVGTGGDLPIETYKQHIECRDACYEISTRDECIPFGHLFDWLGECDDNRAWDEGEDTKNVRSEYTTTVRNFLAQGRRAARLKPDQVEAYNTRHKHRWRPTRNSKQSEQTAPGAVK